MSKKKYLHGKEKTIEANTQFFLGIFTYTGVIDDVLTNCDKSG